MSNKEFFPLIILLGRPAAGKSEVIDFLKKNPENTRKELFRVGDFEEIDDFPMLWTWFEEDQVLEEMGQERLHTTPDGYFKNQQLWQLLIKRVELEYRKKLADTPGLAEKKTIIIEFSRGAEHGGFESAFQQFSPDLLKKAAVLYIKTSYEESLRKNRKRFNPNRPHSILEHGLPDEKMERLYKESDWERLSGRDPDYLHIQGVRVPYGVLENEDDVTSRGGKVLGDRLQETLQGLWKKTRTHPS